MLTFILCHLSVLQTFFSAVTFDNIFYENLSSLAYTYKANSSTTLTPFLALAFMVYLIGFTGIVLGFKNFFLTMLSTEMMYSGVIVAFFLVGTIGYPEFSVCGLLLLVVAASESAIGLSILVVLYRFGNSIKISDYQELRSSFVSPQKFFFYFGILNLYRTCFKLILLPKLYCFSFCRDYCYFIVYYFNFYFLCTIFSYGLRHRKIKRVRMRLCTL